jgi:hypothetical protein
VPVIYTYLDGWAERRKRSRERRMAASTTPLPRGADD